MTHVNQARRSRGLVLGALVAALGAAPLAQADAAPVRPAAARAARDVTTTVEVTARDVDASNAKVRMAYGALVGMWRQAFGDLGARFATPGLATYRSAVRTPCGVMRPSNAGYCAADNVIYYDDVFVAGLAKQAAQALGTDGDMAAVGVIAHEMGHAVAMQLGHASPYTYENEATADCLAGAFAEASERNGELEQGDMEEAFFGMASAGDPTPQLTGNRRYDRMLIVRQAAMGHGTREQRTENFDSGYRGGAGACLEEFR